MFFRLKTTIRPLLVGLGLTWWATPAGAQAPTPPPADAVTYQTFYDSLSPYGQWVTDPDYGYAWVPTAGPDFQPYRSRGHWVYTNYGWTWVSDYKWGWAPFHYGRWRYSDAHGWLWVPGYTWGPAWVAWRQSAGYYGWAPLGPPPARSGVHVSIGFSFSFGDAPVAPARWCFVPAAYVASPGIATYYVPPAQTTVVYNNTTIIRNTYVNKTVLTNNTTVINNQPGGQRGSAPGAGQAAFPAGPARADVEKATGQQLTPLAVSDRATPGVGVQGKSLAFYRPAIAAASAPGSGGKSTGTTQPAPAPQHLVPVQDAVAQARRAQPATANRGLLSNNDAQQLSSTDANPFQAAKARRQALQVAKASNGPATGSASSSLAVPVTGPVGTTSRPGQVAAAADNQLAKPTRRARNQPALSQPSADNALANPAANPGNPQSAKQPSQPATPRNQDQQARQQAKQQQQLAKQQQQQAKQQQQQAKQQQVEQQQREQAREQKIARQPTQPPHRQVPHERAGERR